jgi:hypothetical protein
MYKLSKNWSFKSLTAGFYHGNKYLFFLEVTGGPPHSFFFSVGLEFELRDSHLQSRRSYYLSHTSSHHFIHFWEYLYFQIKMMFYYKQLVQVIAKSQVLFLITTILQCAELMLYVNVCFLRILKSKVKIY